MKIFFISVFIGILLASLGANKYLLTKSEKSDIAIVELTAANKYLAQQLATANLKDPNSVTMTKEEYENLQDKATKEPLDSTLSANGKDIDDVETATVETSNYVDSTTIQATVKPSTLVPDQKDTTLLKQLYNSEVSLITKCWGMKGVITSTDPNPTFKVTDQLAHQSVQSIVYKPKYILGIIRIKKERLEVYSDCGKPLSNTITFKKQ